MGMRYVGQRYCGPRYFGPRYFGGAVVAGVESAAYIGKLALSPGAPAVIDIGSTNTLTLSAFQNTLTDAFPTDATVSAQLIGPSNAVVTTLALPHVSGTTDSMTLYRGVLRASVTRALAEQRYTFVITATDTNGNVRVFYFPCAAQKA